MVLRVCEARAHERDSLCRAHGIHAHQSSRGGERGLGAGRDEAGTPGPALHKRLEMSRVPHIVDDQQEGVVGQDGGKVCSRQGAIHQPGMFPGEGGDQFVEQAYQVCWAFTEGDPADTGGKCGLHLGILTERLREGGLAKATSTDEGEWTPAGASGRPIQQLGVQTLKDLGPGHHGGRGAWGQVVA